jgi:hypothetical protein
MKKLILEYLNNYQKRWGMADDNTQSLLKVEYFAFCSAYSLPVLSADDLIYSLENGKLWEIIEAKDLKNENNG